MGDRDSGTLIISHLLFANDTLIFDVANQGHIRSLRALLLCFEAVLGFKVNLAKSKLAPVWNPNVDNLASLIGCKVLFPYLRNTLATLWVPYSSLR